MKKVISQFFSDLGYPFRNIRWSWGARSGDAILLRTWDDELVFKERKLTVLDMEDVDERDSYGLDERIVHLKALWNGGIAGYTVIATAKDKHARPREIVAYRDDAVFALSRLERTSKGDIIAILGEVVPVSVLAKHAQTHRTAQGEGVFPVDDAQRSGLSTESYKEKIPAMRAWLIEVCDGRGTVTYSDVMNRFALTFYPLRNAMSRLGQDCKDAGEPIITALIVDKDTHRCSQGFFEEFRIDDDELERERCYAHWASSDDDAPSSPTPAPAASAAGPSGPAGDLEHRAARFAQVQIRRDQGPFRDAVFRAYEGRCAISGCAVPEALEAAHLLGRDWRQGHNSATDGILLRRDLHNLYDRGLLRISDEGQVELSGDVMAYYREFNGAVVTISGRAST
jgi:hypothetical protein